MRQFALIALLLMPLLAKADDPVDRVLTQVVLPGVEDFAEKTATLAQAAQKDCTPQNPDLISAWNGAMDAWFGIQDLRVGPLEEGSRRQIIAFWPDIAGHRQRALGRILSGQDKILQTPEKYYEEPVSARGLYAIETMLFDPDFNGYTTADPGCGLVRAASADLANIGAEVKTTWESDFVTVMRTAGSAQNTRFLDVSEARQVLFTALLTSLQFDVNERLGLPLGTFDKPRALRAEGRLSARSQRNLALSLANHEKLALALVEDENVAVGTREDFQRLRWMVSELDDPDFSGVDDPASRFKLEAVQTGITLLRGTVNKEFSEALGVTMGLNALDGD
jgi:uncharacterized protein